MISHWGGFVYAAATAQEGVSEPPRIFLAEALIAMAIGSLLLMGPAAFCLPCSVIFCARGEQLAPENELWQRVHAVGKHLQRAGYCRGACGGAGLD